jgi:hypothetical protein
MDDAAAPETAAASPPFAAASSLSTLSSAAAIEGLVLQLVWRPSMEATAGLFLLGRAAGSSASPASLRQVWEARPTTTPPPKTLTLLHR